MADLARFTDLDVGAFVAHVLRCGDCPPNGVSAERTYCPDGQRLLNAVTQRMADAIDARCAREVYDQIYGTVKDT